MRPRDAIVAAIFAIAAQAQTAGPPPRFEAAEIQSSPRSMNSDSNDMNGGIMRSGRYVLRRATMLDLVHLAYGVDAKKILGGPDWLALDRFDIRAKAPAGTTAASVKPLLQTLLAERFGLAVHSDTKPVPTWVLTAGKHPLPRRAAGTGDSGCRSAESNGFVEMTCRNATMAAFAASLGAGNDGAWYYLTDNLVADQTGLEGAWDFEMKYSARWRTKTAGAEIVSIFDAIEKLGLRLDASPVDTAVLVVDRVNRIPAPNPPGTEALLPPAPTAFEVADIRPEDPSYHGDDLQLREGGRVRARGQTLKGLIADSWGVEEEMVADAPKFVDSDRWDIVAKAPDIMAADGDADYDGLLAMVRNLLAERFHLAVHFEDRVMPGPVLTAPKARLQKADPAARSGCKEGPATLTKMDPRGVNPVLGRFFTCTNVTMEYFTQQLQFLASAYVHGDVLDATGLAGGWNFALSFSKIAQLRGTGPLAQEAQAASDPNGALSVQDALEKQLGLKLEMQKRPVRVLVIDHIDQKPTEN